MSRDGLASYPTLLRITADVLMCVFALAVSMLGAFLAAIRTSSDHAAAVAALHAGLGVQLPILALLVAAVYSAYGVYGRVRVLPPREKALQLLVAAGLAFAGLWLLQPLLPGSLRLGLPALLWGWALAALFATGSRQWSTTWRALTLAEAGGARIAGARAGTAAEPRGAKPRVLVIGGAGYVGSALGPRLLRAGFRVRVLDLLLFGEAPIAAVKDHPDFELVKADFRQVDRLVDAMQGVDVVVHLGGLVGDPACALDRRLTTEVNLDFTRLIAEVAKGAHVPRFVFASSCSVYGASDAILDEGSELNPVSLYGRSKIASENILFDMATPAFAPTMLRFGTIYGLSARPRFDLVVNLLTAKAVVDGKITVFGGDQWRPFVHVQDAARAVVMVLQAPLETVRNEIFNVGSDEQNATLADIAAMIRRIVPTAEIVDSGRDEDRRNYRVSFAKIRGRLRFTPDWTLDAGIREIAEAVRSGAVQDYTAPVYSDVRFLKEGMAPRYTRVRQDWAPQRMDGDPTHSSKARADERLRSAGAAAQAADARARSGPGAAGAPGVAGAAGASGSPHPAGAAGEAAGPDAEDGRGARVVRKPGPLRG